LGRVSAMHPGSSETQPPKGKSARKIMKRLALFSSVLLSAALVTLYIVWGHI